MALSLRVLIGYCSYKSSTRLDKLDHDNEQAMFLQGLDKPHAVVRADRGRGGEVEGVEYADGVRLVGQVLDLAAAGPPESGCLAGCGQGAAGLGGGGGERGDALAHVLVHAGQRGRLHVQAGLLGDLAAQALGDFLAELQDTAGRLPVAVIAPPDEQGTVLAVDHHGGNAHRVPWAVCHRRVTSSATLAPVDHTYRQVEEYSCHQI